MIYVVIQEQEEIPMHFKRQAQIGALLFNKAFTEVLAEYSNYSNIFLVKNAAKFLENTKIKEHTIKLEKDKQLPFRPIYSLGSVELEIPISKST